MEALHTLYRIGGYGLYKIRENHRHGHGIHSPFMFHFIREILEGSTLPPCLQTIENFRNSALHDHTIISGNEYGAGSRFGNGLNKPFSHWVKHSSVNKRFGRLLYQIALDLKPETILEMGTAAGIGTMYLASANSSVPVHTVEGNENLAVLALTNFKKFNFQNIHLFNCTFREYFKNHMKFPQQRMLVWLDGDHRGPLLKEYLEQLLDVCASGSIIVLDDIRWSESMHLAWKQIKDDPRIPVTIDLWNAGIIFIFNHLQKENYLVKF